MGNMLEEEVKRLLKDGWTPRIKSVKGHKYITVRKGRREKSLGPYNEELFKMIANHCEVKPTLTLEEWNALKSIQANYSNTVAELKAEIDALKAKQAVTDEFSKLAKLKTSQCPYIKSWYGQNFCSKYSWERKPTEIIELFNQVAFKRNKMNNKNRWRFTPHSDICWSCTELLESIHEHNILERVTDEFEGVSVSVKLLKQSAEIRVRDDKYGCIHLGEDGFCKFWFYHNYQWDRDQKSDDYKGKIVYRDHVKKHPEICASCPSFKSRETKET